MRGRPLFYIAPPSPEGVTDERLGNLINSFASQGGPRRIVYLSTTGVYGDCGGAWVDEGRTVQPVAPRARRRWNAEQRLRTWRDHDGGELVILRVAGIYGPGKLPLDRLRKRLPLIQESEAPFSNRIHIDDLVQVCVAAMERGGDGEIYNVSDGHPTTMTDYFSRLADQAGLPRPPLITLGEGDRQLSAGMMSYMRESRRLNNRKLREELGVELCYPDLESGLRACFREQRTENRRQKKTKPFTG
jgi:nucleoside-diphosphate-sugar epimerase